jgi:hypothetical protein
MLSEVFYMAVLSTGSGVLLAVLGLLYKSKCEDVSCCFGFVKIHRNIDSEVLEDMQQHTSVTSTHEFNNGNETHRLSNQSVQPLQIESR